MKKLFLLLVLIRLSLPSQASPITGTFGIPTDYVTIAAAVTAINTNGVDYGGVTFIVADGYTESTVGLTLSTTTTIDNHHFIIFRKATGALVNPKLTASGSAGNSDAAIAIVGTSFVTFDGIDIAVSGANVEYGYLIQNASVTNGSQNDTIRNCKITLDKSNTNSSGILQLPAFTPSSATGANSYNVFHKIIVDNAYNGIGLTSQTTFRDINCVIDSCSIGTAGSNSIGGGGTQATWGIRCEGFNGMKVFGCEVCNITMSGSKNIGGIFFSTCIGLCEVFNNKVHDLKVSSTAVTSVPIALRIEELPGETASLYNNMAWGFSHGATTPTATLLCRAISINSQASYTGTVNVFYNTVVVSMGAAPSTTAFSVQYGLVNVKNNIFINLSTAGSNSSRYCYYASSGTINSSDNNDLYIPTSTTSFTGYYGSNKSSLSDWRTATGKDANSLSIPVTFISSPDLHVDVYTNCTLDGKGCVIAGITKDIDNDIRNTSTPDIGADEFNSIPPTITSTTPSSVCTSGSLTLQATASLGSVTWWDAITGGTNVGSGNSYVTPTIYTTTDYYTEAVNGTCISSPRTAVTATISTQSAAPTGIHVTLDPICIGESTDLTVTGGHLGSGASWVWFADNCGGTPVGTGTTITVSPVVTTNYYVRADGTCNSTICSSIKVTVNDNVATPSFTLGTASTICSGSAPVTYTATAAANTGITYSLDAASITGGNSIDALTGQVTYNPLWTGTTTITASASGCNGPLTSDHVVTVNACNITLNIKAFLAGFYKGGNRMRTASNSSFHPQLGANIADTISVEFHDGSNYSNIIYKVHGVILDTNGNATLHIPLSYNGSYFITVKQRNHIETVSAATVSFAGTTVNYNYTDNANKAYGNNMKDMGSGVFGFYGGDITQSGSSFEYPQTPIPDGMIDLDDVYYVFSSYLHGDYGYLFADMNGDGMVDINDVYISYDNYLLGVYTNTP